MFPLCVFNEILSSWLLVLPLVKYLGHYYIREIDPPRECLQFFLMSRTLHWVGLILNVPYVSKIQIFFNFQQLVFVSSAIESQPDV